MDSFFGIGMFELIMIAIIALVVMGPERLPAAMREVAKWMKQVRHVSNEFTSQFSEELKMLDELNPRRILNEALDPNAKPAAPATPAAKASAPAVRPVTAAALPVVEPVKTPIPNAETTNTILPPPVTSVPNETPAVSAGSVEAPAANAAATQPEAAAQPTDPDDSGAEAVR